MFGIHQCEVLQFGHSPVKGHLTTFKTRAGRPAGTGFLATHAEATARTLTSGDTAALAQFAAAGALIGLKGIKSESHGESGIDLLEGDPPFLGGLLVCAETFERHHGGAGIVERSLAAQSFGQHVFNAG